MSAAHFVEIAPGVSVTTAVKYTTNTTVVRRDDRVVIVDPAWTQMDLDGIVGWMRAEGLHITTGLSTHGHFDHVLWHPEFGDGPRWGSPKAVAMANDDRVLIREHLARDIPEEWPHPVDGLLALDGTHVPDPFADGDMEEIHLVVHDGHAPGHTAMWFPDRGVLLAGDMLSDIELPLPFEPDDLPAYLAALDTLAPVVASARVLVPGHGHVTDRPMDRLDADRRYLDDVLSRGDSDDPRRALGEMETMHQKVVALARELAR